MRAWLVIFLIASVGGCLVDWYVPSPDDVRLRDEGIAGNDTVLCEKIKDQMQKDSCYLGVGLSSEELTTCDKIGSVGVKSACYNAIAVALNDTGLCVGLNGTANIPSPDWFWESCIQKIALRLGNASHCEKLTREKPRLSCIEKISMAGKGQ